MEKKPSFKEQLAYYSIKITAAFIRMLPVNLALWIGRRVGSVMFVFDVKHKAQTYANLRMAFGDTKSPRELRNITKEAFRKFGMNIIDLFRLPLLNKQTFEKYISYEGREHIDEAFKQGNGCIILAMHFGSWELANISCAMHDYPYKVLVRKQQRFQKLNSLLNKYRSCNGSVVISRGAGTRDLVKSLKNNELVAMVVDQGGKDGVLVPFFKRYASLSVGAIRIALKYNVPICFSVITRQNGPNHKITIHKPFDLVNTGDLENDVKENLKQIVKLMESFIHKYPSEYIWMYKIWKYSKESNITILSDDKTGHLRQSQTIASVLQEALLERDISSDVNTIQVKYKSQKHKKAFSIVYKFLGGFFCYGRLGLLKFFVTQDTYKALSLVKTDYVVSCGSSVAGLNHLIAKDNCAKSIGILKPGIMNTNKYDVLFLPQHDIRSDDYISENVKILKGAANLINDDYLNDQTEKLLNRFSHLKSKVRYKIGLFIGGDAKGVYISEDQVRLLIRQLKEAAQGLNADILVTTSRRTPANIDQLLFRKLKKDPRCPLMVLPNREDVPEAVGGILGLSNIVIVSGDSISMVSEAASSGKKTIVFLPKRRDLLLKNNNKHRAFVEKLNEQGYILSSRTKDIGQSIFDIAKQKIQTRPLNDNKTILKAVKEII